MKNMKKIDKSFTFFVRVSFREW